MRAIVFLVTASVILRLFGTAIDADSGTERWLFMPPGISLPQGPGGQMALQTACAFLMAGMAFLLLTISPENAAAANAAGYLGSGVATLGLVFLLSYAYGAPFFTGEPIIPMALHSSLAFVALGGGLIATAGPGAAPLRLLVGPSVQAQLLRAFVPFTILVVAFPASCLRRAQFEASPAAFINSIVAVVQSASSAFCVPGITWRRSRTRQLELRQIEHSAGATPASCKCSTPRSCVACRSGPPPRTLSNARPWD